MRKRLACMLYEGVVLFGVVVITALFFAGIVQQRHALEHRAGLQIVLFFVLGAYFVWFWTHSGQTVAMKTWHIRLTRRDGQPVGYLRAIARYVLSYVWFMPVLAVLATRHEATAAQIFLWMGLWILAYAWTFKLHGTRQYWHDMICGTQLITWQPPRKPKPAKRRG